MDAEHDALVEARDALREVHSFLDDLDPNASSLLLLMSVSATLAKIDKALEDEG